MFLIITMVQFILICGSNTMLINLLLYALIDSTSICSFDLVILHFATLLTSFVFNVIICLSSANNKLILIILILKSHQCHYNDQNETNIGNVKNLSLICIY